MYDDSFSTDATSATGASSRGTSFTSSASKRAAREAARAKSAGQAVNPRVREAFSRFSKGRSAIKLADLERVAKKGLGLDLTKRQLDQMRGVIDQHDEFGDIDFALFQTLVLPYLSAK